MSSSAGLTLIRTSEASVFEPNVASLGRNLLLLNKLRLVVCGIS